MNKAELLETLRSLTLEERHDLDHFLSRVWHCDDCGTLYDILDTPAVEWQEDGLTRSKAVCKKCYAAYVREPAQAK